jgi:transcription elongation factor Elf1
MVNGETCPVCGSKNVSDNTICYTYDNIAKTCADWNCEECGADYAVMYKAEKIVVTPWDDTIDDLDEDAQFEVIL